MLIFGHTYLKSERFYHIHDVDSILQTPSNSLLFIEFDEQNLDVIEYMKDNGLSYALEVKTLKEAIFAEYLNAKYLICTKEIVKSIQDRAEHYLFDAKVLCRIEDDDEIEALAISGVDGVIFSDAVIKI